VPKKVVLAVTVGEKRLKILKLIMLLPRKMNQQSNQLVVHQTVAIIKIRKLILRTTSPHLPSSESSNKRSAQRAMKRSHEHPGRMENSEL
jgi:hypothetical protein